MIGVSESGKKMPKKKRPVGRPEIFPDGFEQIHIKFDPEVKKVFQDHCKRMGYSMSRIIAKLVEKFLINRGEL